MINVWYTPDDDDVNEIDYDFDDVYELDSSFISCE